MADFMNPSADLQAGREAGWNDRQREIDDLLDQVTALEERLAAEEAAKIPRPPKAEWFGTGPNQWDSWWITGIGRLKEVHIYGNVFDCLICGINEAGEYIIDMLNLPSYAYIPVAREGCPVPVGWHVVGEGSTQ